MDANKSIPLHIFKHGVMFVIGSLDYLYSVAKEGEFDYEIRRAMEGMRDYNGLTFYLESGDAVVYMRDLPKTIEDYAVVVHELHHAASYILRNLGISLNEGSEECYAYANEYLYYKVVDWFNSLEETSEQHE